VLSHVLARESAQLLIRRFPTLYRCLHLVALELVRDRVVHTVAVRWDVLDCQVGLPQLGEDDIGLDLALANGVLVGLLNPRLTLTLLLCLFILASLRLRWTLRLGWRRRLRRNSLDSGGRLVITLLERNRSLVGQQHTTGPQTNTDLRTTNAASSASWRVLTSSSIFWICASMSFLESLSFLAFFWKLLISVCRF
jgi:hypothetical protein